MINKSNWFEKSQYREDNRDWIKYSQAVALKILLALREQNISKNEIADKLGISLHEVNNYVKGTENFTLQTISKLETTLNINLISIVK